MALSFPGCHRRGGVERIIYECSRYLSGRGHDVHVFANEWEADHDGRICYHRVPAIRRPAFLRGVSYQHLCTKVLLRQEYDVLNTHGCVCPTGGVQWVQSLHAAWLERAKSFRPPLSWSRLRQSVNPLHPLLLHLERRHFRDRGYRKLIATTEEVRSDLNVFYGVPRDDVVVIPNGFSPTEFSPDRRTEGRNAARRRLSLHDDHVVFLFVANELERKGYRTILEAMRILDRREARLVVIGQPDPGVVMRMAAAAGVAGQVIARGLSQNVAEFHAAADLFVLPTQYEAFCLAILEALGSGLPVVTTCVPGARDAIRSGVNGVLINDPKNGQELAAVLAPLMDPSARNRLAASAAPSVAGYQWPVVLQQYEGVLQDCAQTASRATRSSAAVA